MSLTINGTAAQIKEMLEYYDGYLIYGENSHTIARAKLENITVTFYTTNTILFQGKSEIGEYNIWAKKFNLPIQEEVTSDYEIYQHMSAIGCDEVGTGDYFGPVVVCSCFVREDQIDQLKHLGVKDSKLLMDDVIIDLALKLRNIVQYSILVLPPEKFNSLHRPEDNNLNFIKACLHNNAINSLMRKLSPTTPDCILIDEFTTKDKYFHYLRKLPNVEKNVVLIPKGERVHVSIAAASILARAAFLKEMTLLSKEVKVELLKGASRAVDKQAVGLIKSYGLSILNKIAKKKFVNTERVIEYCKENNIKIIENKEL